MGVHGKTQGLDCFEDCRPFYRFIHYQRQVYRKRQSVNDPFVFSIYSGVSEVSESGMVLKFAKKFSNGRFFIGGHH